MIKTAGDAERDQGGGQQTRVKAGVSTPDERADENEREIAPRVLRLTDDSGGDPRLIGNAEGGFEWRGQRRSFERFALGFGIFSGTPGKSSMGERTKKSGKNAQCCGENKSVGPTAIVHK